MIRRPVKIGVAGTHSTGKSSFLKALAPVLQQLGLSATTIGGLPSGRKRSDFRYSPTIPSTARGSWTEKFAAGSGGVVALRRHSGRSARA